MKIKIPIELDLETIAHITNAKLIGHNLPVSFISTDTRKDVSDSLFIPIKGQTFDGHKFITEAYNLGAVASFSSEQFWEKNLSFQELTKPILLVKDTTEAFLRLAYYVRKKLDIFVIAVGGSVGKTTTKELTYFILTELGVKSHKSMKSFNNNVGLAISLISADKEKKVAVLEIGTSSKGEIPYLTRFADPDLGVITSVGKEHLEGLEDEYGVFLEEIELIKYVVKKGGISVLNIGNQMLGEYFLSIPEPKIGFFMQNKNGSLEEKFKNSKVGNSILVRCKLEQADEFLNSTFRVFFGEESLHLRTNLPPHFGEILAGALASVLGFFRKNANVQELKRISEIDFGKFENEKGRFKVTFLRNIFIVDDTYNSNPTSVDGMFFSASFAKGRKIFVLGDMLELGKKSEEEHRNIGNLARRYFREDEAFFIVNGEFSEHLFKGLNENGFSVLEIGERPKISQYLKKIVKSGDYVFFKASRRCKFEEILSDFSDAIRNQIS